MQKITEVGQLNIELIQFYLDKIRQLVINKENITIARVLKSLLGGYRGHDLISMTIWEQTRSHTEFAKQLAEEACNHYAAKDAPKTIANYLRQGTNSSAVVKLKPEGKFLSLLTAFFYYYWQHYDMGRVYRNPTPSEEILKPVITPVILFSNYETEERINYLIGQVSNTNIITARNACTALGDIDTSSPYQQKVISILLGKVSDYSINIWAIEALGNIKNYTRYNLIRVYNKLKNFIKETYPNPSVATQQISACIITLAKLALSEDQQNDFVKQLYQLIDLKDISTDENKYANIRETVCNVLVTMELSPCNKDGAIDTLKKVIQHESVSEVVCSALVAISHLTFHDYFFSKEINKLLAKRSDKGEEFLIKLTLLSVYSGSRKIFDDMFISDVVKEARKKIEDHLASKENKDALKLIKLLYPFLGKFNLHFNRNYFTLENEYFSTADSLFFDDKVRSMAFDFIISTKKNLCDKSSRFAGSFPESYMDIFLNVYKNDIRFRQEIAKSYSQKILSHPNIRNEDLSRIYALATTILDQLDESEQHINSKIALLSICEIIKSKLIPKNNKSLKHKSSNHFFYMSSGKGWATTSPSQKQKINTQWLDNIINEKSEGNKQENRTGADTLFNENTKNGQNPQESDEIKFNESSSSAASNYTQL